MNTDEKLIANYIVLLLGKLTNWNHPVGDPGDPIYLTGEQTAELAAEGIRLLAPFLSKEAGLRVASAIEGLPRAHPGSRDDLLIEIGRLGGLFDRQAAEKGKGMARAHAVHSAVHSVNPGEPPGCCIRESWGLVCVR